MFSLPDWAPNAHPLVVHFPIAIPFVAALADFVALVVRRHGWLRSVSVGLYVLGAIAALAALLTGQRAADGISLPAGADPVLTEHEEWAERTVWFYGVFALIRLGAAWHDRKRRLAFHLPLFLIGAGGLWLVVETGEHGAQMVFQHGVGVAAMRGAKAEAHDRAQEQENTEEGPRFDQSGAWSWDVGRGGDRALQERFEWLEGSPSEMKPSVVHDGSEGEVLALRPAGSRAIFVAGSPLGSLQFDLRLNLDGFDGKAALIHHVADARNYHFLELGSGRARLGRIADGSAEVEAEGRADDAGWISIRVVSDGAHFRSYIGDKMIAHGHGHEPEPGRVGLLVEGTGTLLVDRFEVQALR